MATNFEGGVFIDDKIVIDEVGEIPVKLTKDSLQKRPIYLEALKLHRGIKDPDDVNIGDPIVLFYIVTLSQGFYDQEYKEKVLTEGYRGMSQDVAEMAVKLARDYHQKAANSAREEAFLVTMVDEIFVIDRAPTGQMLIRVRDDLKFPEVNPTYFNDQIENERRAADGLPPLFPRNQMLPVEQKLKFINTLISKHPMFMQKIQGMFTTSIVEEIQKAIANQEAPDTDPAGFRVSTTDRDLPVSADAVSQEPDAGSA